MPWLILVVSILLLLLLSPIRFCFAYGENTSLCLRYLFFKMTFLPSKPQKEKPPKKKKSAKKAAKQKEAKKSKFSFADILGLLKVGIKGSSKLLRAVTISKIVLVVSVGGEDAADTAIAYGRMSCYIHTALASMRNVLRLKLRSVRILPDFDSAKSNVSASCTAKIRPLSVFAIGFYLLFAVLRLLIFPAKSAPVTKTQA